MSPHHTWTTSTRAAFLAAARPFRGLTPETVQWLAAGLRPRYVRRGAFVFLAGGETGAFCLVAAGRVKVVVEAGSHQEVVLRLIGPGDVFGDAGVWGEAIYSVSAVALRDTVVLQMLTRDFTALLDAHPDLALAVIRELGRRLRGAEARIHDLQTEPVERRLARAVLRLAAETGQEQAGAAGGDHPGRSLELPGPLSRRDLASLAGTTVSTASRTLRAWHRRGIVVAGRERVAVRRPPGLVTLAGGPGPPIAERGTRCADTKSALP